MCGKDENNLTGKLPATYPPSSSLFPPNTRGETKVLQSMTLNTPLVFVGRWEEVRGVTGVVFDVLCGRSQDIRRNFD